jgi:hypothetical protein
MKYPTYYIFFCFLFGKIRCFLFFVRIFTATKIIYTSINYIYKHADLRNSKHRRQK